MTEKKKWAYCSKCMDQEWHTQSADGTWWCDNHKGPNRLIGLGIAGSIFGGVRKILVPPKEDDNG